MSEEAKPKPERIVFRVGKNIYLRPVLKEDLPKLTIWINDPEVTMFLKASLPMTPEDEEGWYKKLSQKNDTEIRLSIVLKETDEFIGIIALHKINRQNGTATSGSFIGRKDFWGKGYGTEASTLLLEYAFNTLNLRKINSSVLTYNVRSKRRLEKCGYKEEGVRKAQIYRLGQYHDEILMAVFREDFLPFWEHYRSAFS